MLGPHSARALIGPWASSMACRVQAADTEHSLKPMGRVRALAGIAVLAGGIVACNQPAKPDCLALPCALPLAISIDVTAAAGGPVPGVTVALSGAESGSASCNVGSSSTQCYVPGTAGTYNVQVVAPGFQTQSQTITVEGSNPPCGCPVVQTRQVNVVLTPS